MIETPAIGEIDHQHTAVIALKIPRTKMQEEFGPAVEEIANVVSEQDIDITGPVFAHHFAMSPDIFDFEVGIITAEPITPSGRVTAGHTPATKVARTVHHGPYEGLPDAWSEFHEWLDDHDIDWAPDVWEFYTVGPANGEDPADWLTELIRPLKS